MKLSITITLCALLYFSGAAVATSWPGPGAPPGRRGIVDPPGETGARPPGIRAIPRPPGDSNPKAYCDYYFSYPWLCDGDTQPVCATDDNTYDNICKLCDMRKYSGLNSLWIRRYGRC